jgi:hypothetical protein
MGCVVFHEVWALFFCDIVYWLDIYDGTVAHRNTGSYTGLHRNRINTNINASSGVQTHITGIRTSENN